MKMNGTSVTKGQFDSVEVAKTFLQKVRAFSEFAADMRLDYKPVRLCADSGRKAEELRKALTEMTPVELVNNWYPSGSKFLGGLEYTPGLVEFVQACVRQRQGEDWGEFHSFAKVADHALWGLSLPSDISQTILPLLPRFMPMEIQWQHFTPSLGCQGRPDFFSYAFYYNEAYQQHYAKPNTPANTYSM